MLRDEFKDFANEFPTVFGMVIGEGVFMINSFLKYIEYRRSRPVVYTKEEDSIDDLVFYPLAAWKEMHPHYDNRLYHEFKD